MNWWKRSATFTGDIPGARGASENVNPGIEGTTTSNPSAASRLEESRCSTKEPGQPWITSSGVCPAGPRSTIAWTSSPSTGPRTWARWLRRSCQANQS